MRLDELGEAEIENFHAAIAREENVVGLEIAVDDAFVVRGGEAAGDLVCDLERLARRESTLLAGGNFSSSGRARRTCRAGARRSCSRRTPVHRETLAERFAFEELGDDVGRAIVHAEIVHGENIRMIELARGARFLFKAAQAFGIFRERSRQYFYGDVAAELRIAGAMAAGPCRPRLFERRFRRCRVWFQERETVSI